MRKHTLAKAFRLSLLAATVFTYTAVEDAFGQRTGGARTQQQQPELPTVELQGEDKFDAVSQPLVPGLYQVAYSAKNDALFVTSAVGRQVSSSELVKVDPKSLEIVAKIQIARNPDTEEGTVHAVYGVGVDDTNGNVWVTNTRTGGVAVYKQSDLSLVKQFPAETVAHTRDVIVDEKNGKVYVSGRDPALFVFDAKTLEAAGKIELKTASTDEGAAFMPLSLVIDSDGGKLYAVGTRTGEVAVVDLASGSVDKVFAVENAGNASGVGFDSDKKRVLVASQRTGNLISVDPVSEKVDFDLLVGAGALNVSYEPVSKLYYVTTFRAGTVAVVDNEGKLVGNLDVGTSPNHLKQDGKGNVFVVNKSRGEDDPKGNRITRLKAKAQ